MQHRFGIGYDIHRLIEGRKLVLGGIEIPHGKGLEGHSDADVLTHAVCDAILGALGQGDIGEHFPNTDPRYKNISSMVLLGKVNDMLTIAGYRIVNIDTVIQAEEPNLKEHKPQIRSHLSFKLGIDKTRVNIKATTQEKLGAIGKGEGIAAFASVLLEKA